MYLTSTTIIRLQVLLDMNLQPFDFQVISNICQLYNLPPGPGIGAEAEPIRSEVVVVVEVATAVVIEVTLGCTTTNQPVGTESGKIR